MLFVMSFLAFSSLGFAVQSESHYVWGFDYEGLNLNIYAPYSAYPIDWITIRVRLEAKAELSHIYVKISLYGSKLEGYDTWGYSFYAFYDAGSFSSGTLRDLNFDIQIPSDASPGLIYSITECSWDVKWTVWYSRSKDGVFRVTYIKNKAYEDLQEAFKTLNETYENYKASHSYTNIQYVNLNDSYNTLESDYNNYVATHNHTNIEYDNLNSAYNNYVPTHTHTNTEYDSLQTSYNNMRTLMVLFIITTGIFVTTTLYYAKRKK